MIVFKVNEVYLWSKEITTKIKNYSNLNFILEHMLPEKTEPFNFTEIVENPNPLALDNVSKERIKTT